MKHGDVGLPLGYSWELTRGSFSENPLPMGSMGICESKHLLALGAANTTKTCLLRTFFFVYIVLTCIDNVLTDVPRS